MAVAGADVAAPSLVAVPMFKDNELVGAISSIARRSGHLQTSRSNW